MSGGILSNAWSYSAQVDLDERNQDVVFKIPTRPAFLRQRMAATKHGQEEFQRLPGFHRMFPTVLQPLRRASIDSLTQDRPDVRVVGAPTQPMAMRRRGLYQSLGKGVAAGYLSRRPLADQESRGS